MTWSTWMLVLAVALGWLVPALAGRVGVAAERARGRVAGNYRGVPVPLGLGWAWLAWGVAAAVLARFGALHGGTAEVRLGVLVAGTAALGWLDDRFGDPAARGFRGHLDEALRGRVTTGLLKLVGIVALSLWAAYPLPGTMDGPHRPAVRIAAWITAAAVIALAANLTNLLDLRPGRALKAYVIMVVPPLSWLAWGWMFPGIWAGWVGASIALVYAVTFLGPVFACWGADAREQAMLGDMGANAAGAVAGWMLARITASRSLPALGLVAVVLVALNLASERVSFSAVIERNAVLRRLDALGRTRHVGGKEQTVDGETGS